MKAFFIGLEIESILISLLDTPFVFNCIVKSCTQAPTALEAKFPPIQSEMTSLAWATSRYIGVIVSQAEENAQALSCEHGDQTQLFISNELSGNSILILKDTCIYESGNSILILKDTCIHELSGNSILILKDTCIYELSGNSILIHKDTCIYELSGNSILIHKNTCIYNTVCANVHVCVYL